MSPTRTAQSKPSAPISTMRSDRFSEMVTSGWMSRNCGTSGATWRRPNPAGAVIRKWPLAFTPPSVTLASALATSARMRWHCSKNALPSWVRLIRRVVRSNSLTPKRSSSASSLRPMMAGATPSASAAAVRLPRVATDTNDSSCLNLLMRLRRPSPPPGHGAGQRCLLCHIPIPPAWHRYVRPGSADSAARPAAHPPW